MALALTACPRLPPRLLKVAARATRQREGATTGGAGAAAHGHLEAGQAAPATSGGAEPSRLPGPAEASKGRRQAGGGDVVADGSDGQVDDKDCDKAKLPCAQTRRQGRSRRGTAAPAGRPGTRAPSEARLSEAYNAERAGPPRRVHLASREVYSPDTGRAGPGPQR